MIRGLGIFGAVFLVGLLGNCQHSSSHEAPSGSWHYDPKCCGNGDCMPIDGILNIDGVPYYQTKLGARAADKSTYILQSGDQFTHACIFNSRLYCLYIPQSN